MMRLWKVGAGNERMLLECVGRRFSVTMEIMFEKEGHFKCFRWNALFSCCAASEVSLAEEEEEEEEEDEVVAALSGVVEGSERSKAEPFFGISGTISLSMTMKGSKPRLASCTT